MALNPADTALTLEAMSDEEVIADVMAVSSCDFVVWWVVVVCWWRLTPQTRPCDWKQ